MSVKVNRGREEHQVLQHGQHTSSASRLAHRDPGDQVGSENRPGRSSPPEGTTCWLNFDLVAHLPHGQPAQPFDTDGVSGERSHMTKADIADVVYEKVGGFSKKEAIDIVETVFETVKKTLEKGEKIKISGFGNFVVRDKKARPGRNPQTGKEITISARRVLTFKASLLLTKALNS